MARQGKYFGNGVYYFPFSGDVFGDKLSEFIGQHPDLELVTVAGDSSGITEITSGYFVVFRPKEG
jgi:hypothetical protein